MIKMRNVVVLATALASVVLLAPPVRAEFIFSLQPVITATGGSTGNSFDVLLTNTGPATATIGGFSFGITAADAVINFTEANVSTTVDTYIFSGGDSLFGPTISTLTGQTLEASDFSASSGTAFGAGDTFGVGHILFDVASGATPGPIAVTFEEFPITSLSDADGNDVAFTTVGGAITITSPNTVPEPSTEVFLAGAFAALAIARGRRRTM